MKIDINTQEINKELNDLKTIKEEYEDTFRTIFNTLSNSSFFWNDNIAISFYNELENQKIKNEKEIENINSKIEVFTYIYDNYQTLGNKIKCNLESMDYIIEKLNSILNRIQNIIYQYNSLNTSFCPYERNYLINERKKLQSNYTKVTEIKTKIVNSYNKIIEIEREVSNKLSKIDNIRIEEFNEYNYIKE